MARLAVTISADVHDGLLELAEEMEMTVDEFAEVCLAVGVASYAVKLPASRRRETVPPGNPDPDGGRAA